MYRFLILTLLLTIFYPKVPITYSQTAPIERQFVRIGTASISGVYYIAANSVCNFIKKSNKSSKKNVICAVQSTPGTVYNLNALKNKDLEIGVAQADQEFKMYNNQSMPELRSIFDIYNEIFTIVVKKDSNIRTFDDLKGKRVNIGSPGSGTSVMVKELMKIKNWNKKTFQVATELSNAEQVQALCDNKIDAMTVVMAYPNGLLQTAEATCGIKLISVDEETLSLLLNQHPYYTKQEIQHISHEEKNAEKISTFGVRAVFVSREDVNADTIYEMVKVLYENFEIFQGAHPALETISRTDMIPDTNITPLHPGALRFYKEIGLIK